MLLIKESTVVRLVSRLTHGNLTARFLRYVYEVDTLIGALYYTITTNSYVNHSERLTNVSGIMGLLDSHNVIIEAMGEREFTLTHRLLELIYPYLKITFLEADANELSLHARNIRETIPLILSEFITLVTSGSFKRDVGSLIYSRMDLFDDCIVVPYLEIRR